MKQLKDLFEQYTGKKAVSCEELPQSGSNRRYFRLQAEGISLIGAMGTSVEENNAFICLARHFKEEGLNVPEVYISSPDKVYYLQEDLGTVSLFDAISSGRQKGSYNTKEVALLKKTMALLPKFQFEGGRALDYSVCYPQPEFDERNIWFDFNYFKYSFLKTSGLDFSEIRLYDDMKKMAADLLGVMRGNTFMYRDFQARNVMLRDGKQPYFIDFQGGRRGPFYYDIASFVWQARANYSDELKDILIGLAQTNITAIAINVFTKGLIVFICL